jgi:hypothetical protein
MRGNKLGFLEIDLLQNELIDSLPKAWILGRLVYDFKVSAFGTCNCDGVFESSMN